MRVFKPTRKTSSGTTVKYELWYLEFRTHADVVRRLAGFTDKKQTEELGRRIEKLIASRANREAPDKALSEWLEGMPERIREALARYDLLSSRTMAASMPLAEHAADFEAALTAKGSTAAHARLVVSRLTKILDGRGFKYWSDLSAAAVQQFIAGERTKAANAETGERPIGVQTANFYLQAIKQFCKWMVRERRAGESPLAHLQGQNVRTDRRHDRRALSVEELRRLIQAAQVGPVRFGISGAERAIVYRLAVESGLRANELRSLTRGSFNLEGEEPSVTVEAAYSKRRREDQLPLRPETAALLRPHLANKLPTARAFNFPRKEDTAEMLRADLDAARAKWFKEGATPAERAERERSSTLAYRDHAGLVADFHSLRHTFISNLARAGVHPKLAQSLARHSDINLTMSRYTHTTQGGLSAALAALPDLSAMKAAELRATGTDDGQNRVACCVAFSGAETSNSVRDDSPKASTDRDDQERHKRRENHGIHDDSRRPERVPRAGFEPTTPGLGNRCSIL